jgi:FkbM family methyltransferase
MKIVQLGTSRGYDHVTDLINNKKIDFLYLVEANILNIPYLQECYKNIENHHIDNIAIVVEKNSEKIEFFYSSSDGHGGYQISSINRDHVFSYYPREETLKSFEVDCYTLEEYLDIKNIKELDYLFIDVETIDADIILNLNFDKYNIKNIQIEWLHLGDKEIDVINKFISYGYIMNDGIDNEGYDKMFTKI